MEVIMRTLFRQNPTIGTIITMKILNYTSLLVFALLMVKLIVDVLTTINDVTVSFLWIDNLELIKTTVYYLWQRFSFVLISAIILINSSNLNKLHIDKNFLVLYAVTGIIYGIYYFWPTGWLGFLFVGLIAYRLLKNKFNLEHRARPNPAMITVILVIAFCSNWLYKIMFVGTPAIDKYIAFFLEGLPFWVIEEVVFRGMLWASLEAFGWSHFRIMLAQALLFWILHIQYLLLDPLLFWLQLPILAVFLGILVLKYKSIYQSSVAHILFNLR
jgi:hypothetical protein